MELMCAEKIEQDNCFAIRDPNVHEDERVLQDLLNMEHMYVPHCDYFNSVQTNIQPFMRKIVTKWMLEVCDELNCEDQVFPLAVNMFDRFLCTCDTPKKFLQLVAADCILMASKLRQAVTIPIDTLCYYTNYSVNACQMRKYELLVVSKLNWDLLAVTGFDFIDHILERITWSRHNEMIRRHSLILLHLCYTEHEFMRMKSSMIATACIISAIKGLKIQIDFEVFSHICGSTNSAPELVTEVVNRIERIVSNEASVSPNDVKMQQQQSSSANNNCGSNTEKMIPVTTDEEKPETPTDVQDVNF